MNNFQTILIAIFIAFFVFAVLIFSGILPIGQGGSSGSTVKGNVTIWGTVPSAIMNPIVDGLNIKNRDLVIKYQQQESVTYEKTLLEAFASGTSPDIFMLPDNLILKEKGQIFPIPYTSYPQKTFKDTFIDGAEVYLSKDGVLGLPIYVDPLILYYNKDLLSNEAISTPPLYWSGVFGLVPKLTKVKADGSIIQSTIALGAFGNIAHAKDILALLLLQSGNSITTRDDKDNIRSTLNQQFAAGGAISPLETVMKFFVEFSSPSNSAYSWNRAMINSKDLFTGGKLAFYIGPASEILNIESVNPNLSFDVMPIFQTEGSTVRRTSGHIMALAVSKSSKNQSAAVATAMNLSGADSAKTFIEPLYLPPARRDLLATKSDDPYLTSFFASAISVRTWLDPDPAATSKIFNDLVENVISNKLNITSAISKAQGQMDLLINKY